uniref:NB-ARC domain-containing protein n=1 Tax=Leersia perrieri TaxID=77586 RepID=A0A0D9WQR0_9ORYZ
MENAAVSVTTGVLKSLISKLTTLLEKEYSLLTGMRHDIAFLRDELASMDPLLSKLADMEELDPQVKVWRDRVREMAYDIEDCIDLFMHRLGHGTEKVSLVRKTAANICRLGARHEIGKQIHEIVLKTLYVEASNLEGIDSPIEQIVQWLSVDEEKNLDHQPPRVISILGFGGLGKTTLAIQVYNKFKEKFDCAAKPRIKKVLMDLLKDVGAGFDPTDDERQLINKLRGHLTKKRIITTTRRNDVAKACCSSSDDYMYEMKPLSTLDSERLFFKRIFDSEDCPSQLKDAANGILRKCGGLPLAIITISSLLASKPLTFDHWNRVDNFMSITLETNPDIEAMRKILSISYIDLPHYLKTCLLYISIFPEDYTIKRKRLIIRWIAEGFIHEEHGQSVQEIGESYFNELINRRLIQPWYIDPASGQVESCRVHDMILELIKLKAVEENFVTILGAQDLASIPRNKIRRVSVQCGESEQAKVPKGSLVLSHVRSFTIFGHGKHLPSLLEMNTLRVLDLEGCSEINDDHLTGIERLIQLKYLNLRETYISKVPREIVKLQYLDTLDIRNTGITQVPSSIIKLRQLTRLFVDLDTRLPDELGKLENLEELTHVNACIYPMDFPKELAQLTKLRELEISWDSECIQHHLTSYELGLTESLCQLATCKLHSLTLHIINEDEDGFPLHDWHPAPRTLERLRIDMKLGCISEVPRWMGTLVNLQEITLRVKTLGQNGIDILSEVPALRSLALHSEDRRDSRENLITIAGGNSGFRCLKVFRSIWEWMYLSFDVGSVGSKTKRQTN